MAFGKDPSHLQNIPAHGGSIRGGSYAQRMRYAARRPERQRPRGNSFYWIDTYSPPEITTDIIRLIPGSYTFDRSDDQETIVTDTLGFFRYREHYNGRRSCICSAGPLWRNKKAAQPCPACDIYWEDWQERMDKKARGDQTKGPNRMSCRDKYVFNVWDYGLYFEMPTVDDKGQIRVNPKTNQPYTHWVKGAANDPRFQGRPWKQGDLRPWSMSENHIKTLFAYNAQIGKTCKNCGTRDSLRCVMKVCGNKECSAPIYDPNSTEMTQEQREALESSPIQCPHCRQIVFIEEQLECSHCQNPERATFFDVDLQVQATGEKGQQTYLQIFNWSDPRPIQVDTEVLKTITPIDLPSRYAPTPPAMQLKLFGLDQQATRAPMTPPLMGQALPPQVSLPAVASHPLSGVPIPQMQPQAIPAVPYPADNPPWGGEGKATSQ